MNTLIKYRLFFTCIIFIQINFSSEAQFTGHSGVYYLGSADVPIQSAKYSNPDISGYVCRFRWNTVEPSPGVFNWAFVDAEIAKAKSSNKKISLQPLGFPNWIKELKGVKVYYQIDNNQYHSTFGQVIPDVIPWDSAYLSRIKILTDNLALKYAGDTIVSYINLIGGNISRGLPDTVLIDTTSRIKAAFWTSYGYNADTVASKMYPLIDYYMSRFPKTPLWCSVDYVRFESKASGRSDNYLASLYTGYGISKYPDRFGLFREDIAGCTNFNPPPGSHWYIMKNNPCIGGAQMLWSVQDGPVRMNKCGIIPNTKQAVLDSAINKGIAFGMRYIEVYGADIDDAALATNIRNANTKLKNKGNQCKSSTGISVSEVGADRIQIFPNPASQKFTVQFPGSTFDIRIYDLTGRLHYQKKILNSMVEITCEGFPPGIYTIQIYDNQLNGFIRKLIITK